MITLSKTFMAKLGAALCELDSLQDIHGLDLNNPRHVLLLDIKSHYEQHKTFLDHYISSGGDRWYDGADKLLHQTRLLLRSI